ncbi:response regulator [Patescibacteria group bacterium]|nr:response regulator [Patescibacteria group bacterium]
MQEIIPKKLENKEKLSLRILVADDQKVLRDLEKGILEDMGHKVEAVENGQLLMDKLFKENQGFDLIITDIEMPKKSGIEVLREIKYNPNLSKIPVIVISANFDSDEKLKSSVLELGASACLKKPFGEEELYEVVEQAVEQSESVK